MLLWRIILVYTVVHGWEMVMVMRDIIKEIRISLPKRIGIHA